MCPETVVACGDAETGDIVVENGKEEGLPSELDEVGADEANDGGDAEDNDVEPVKVVDKVVPSEWRKGLLSLESVFDVVVGDVEV